MRKILTFFVTIFTLVAVYAAARPSLDGRAVVADPGEMPKGLFARTIGYLPGDSVCVTNPATGSTVDVLILGAIDANEGVAILLSPEAADVLNISKNSNVQVKITKRTGSLDETVTGAALLAEDIEDGVVTTSAPIEETSAPVETVPAETAPVANIEETPLETEISETIEPSPIEEITAAEPETLPIENVQVENIVEAEPVEETFENIPSAVEVTETVPVETLPVETVTEELPALPEENAEKVVVVEEEVEPKGEELPVEPVEVVTEAPAEEPAPEEIVESVKVEEIVPEEKITEEIPAAVENEETAIVEEVPGEIPETTDEEAVTEEIPALEEDKPVEEVVADAAVEEEISPEKIDEEIPPVEEDMTPAMSVASEDTIPVNVPEEEPTVDFDSEISDVAEEETVEVPGVVKEEVEQESDEYQPIVLVPVDNNPPEQSEEIAETADNTETEEEPVKAEVAVQVETPVENVKSVEPTPVETKDFTSFVTTEDKLKKDNWYIQIGSYGNKDTLNNIAKKYGEKYPLAIIELNGGKAYRVMVGPLNVDEYRSVHEKFKSYGYKDSFLKKIK